MGEQIDPDSSVIDKLQGAIVGSFKREAVLGFLLNDGVAAFIIL